MFDRACATDLWQKYEQLLEFNLFFAAWLAAFFLCPVLAQLCSRTVAKEIIIYLFFKIMMFFFHSYLIYI